MRDLVPPYFVGVFCDHSTCDADERGDYLTTDRDAAYAAHRKYLSSEGWQCDETGDWCPRHRMDGAR